ncbi:substrate-binding domain-containing protein [Celerinatantimonas sp. YJH-8]|uniref:substrate-binding domain-containing protein n=1 Tax=Celerinatantimonas sp. YJH-8 TaxID=3228714 RepID=UPI0038C77435
MDATLSIYAAGSLKSVFNFLFPLFTAATGVAIDATFGPAGLLAERIKHGAHVDFFASANCAHPIVLEQLGLAEQGQIFAHNQLCLVMRDDIMVRGQSWLPLLSSRTMKLSSSTPGKDPGGDYVQQFFDRIARWDPQLAMQLRERTLPLVGGSLDSETSLYTPTIPAGVHLVLTHQSDIHIGYANHIATMRAIRGVHVVEIPEHDNIQATYRYTVLKPALSAAIHFGQFLISAPIQQILREYGFIPIENLTDETPPY